MTATITVEEAQARLKELIGNLAPGEEVLITEDSNPVAKLVGQKPSRSGLRPPPGLGKGMMVIVSDDDDHLKDFEDYMP